MPAIYEKTSEILYELKVGDAMKRDIITVTPEDDMNTANQKMSDHKLSGLPVVENGSLVGIISIADIISWLSQGGQNVKIKDKMIKDPKNLYADQPLVHAINKFEKSGYGRFPVLDRDTGKLVGIITKGNIISGALKKLEQEYNEEEVRQYRASHFFRDINADRIDLSLIFKVVGRNFDKAGYASTLMKKNFKRLGIDPDIIRRVSIASYEAEMNIIMFAESGTLQFYIGNERIKILAKDQGPGIEDVALALKQGYTTADASMKEMGYGAGMGFTNIQKCSDKFDIQSTPGIGTILHIDFYLNSMDTGDNNDKQFPD